GSGPARDPATVRRHLEGAAGSGGRAGAARVQRVSGPAAIDRALQSVVLCAAATADRLYQCRWGGRDAPLMKLGEARRLPPTPSFALAIEPQARSFVLPRGSQGTVCGHGIFHALWRRSQCCVCLAGGAQHALKGVEAERLSDYELDGLTGLSADLLVPG